MTRTTIIKSIPSGTLYSILATFTMKELRIFAREYRIPYGKNKANAVWNLIENRSKFADRKITFTLT